MTANNAKARKVADDLPYGLLELETGNFVGFFHTEAAALAAVIDTLDRYGPEGVETLALARFAGNDVESIAEGEMLAERALSALRGQERKTNGAMAAQKPAHVRR